ncbi:CLK4-associating serine/arginine rich protein-like [Lepus europaeus]|uniref:CLK4-associating serine/arginine rich protein-like n=1 Tax=Lepus europaeus TaxID=9983 RepID=UPI002B462963|nr:CLK4-associating serine/arginine rich protein-like [Lepus europaeus]
MRVSGCGLRGGQETAAPPASLGSCRVAGRPRAAGSWLFRQRCRSGWAAAALPAADLLCRRRPKSRAASLGRRAQEEGQGGLAGAGGDPERAGAPGAAPAPRPPPPHPRGGRRAAPPHDQQRDFTSSLRATRGARASKSRGRGTRARTRPTHARRHTRAHSHSHTHTHTRTGQRASRRALRRLLPGGPPPAPVPLCIPRRRRRGGPARVRLFHQSVVHIHTSRGSLEIVDKPPHMWQVLCWLLVTQR